MEEAELKEKLGLARCKIQQAAQEFDLEYRPESYSVLFVSKHESCLLNYLYEAPLYSEFGGTAEERIQNLEGFLHSKLYASVTGSDSTEGCVLPREELEEQKALLLKIQNPQLRSEYEALYTKLDQNMHGRWLTVVSQPGAGKDVEHTVLHEWLHVLLMDNGISFQDKGKNWEWDEGLVTYLMAFLEEEDLDTVINKDTPIVEQERQYLEAGRRWREILKDKQTPQERKAAIVRELES